MKKFLWQFMAVLILASMTVGCSDGDDGGSGDAPVNYTDRVRSLDLSGIQGLYITGDNLDSAHASALRSSSYSVREIQRAASQVDLDPNSLYKVTGDGTLERVQIMDDAGEELPRGVVHPISVKDINAQYLMIWIQVTEAAYEDLSQSTISIGDAFLVHKSTGLAYSASSLVSGVSISTYSDGREPSFTQSEIDIQWDDKNHLYIRKEGNSISTEGKPNWTIYQIDLSSLGDKELTATEIKSAYGIGHKWIVDKEGVFILFNPDDLAAVNTGVIRYLDIQNGSIYNLHNSIPNDLNSDWILGLDNKIYTFVGDTNCIMLTNVCNTLYRVEANADASPKTTKIADTKAFVEPSLLNPKYRHIIGGKLIYMHPAVIESGNIIGQFGMVEIDIENATAYQPHFTMFDKIMKSVLNGSHIYLFGTFASSKTNGLYKYDPVTRTGEQTTVESGYDVQKFQLMASGEFLVEGIRLSDQAYFYGRLSTDGVITVTSTVAIGAPKVIVMAAISPTDFMTIDGSASEWSTSLRVLTDVSTDGQADGELLYYSQSSSNAQYFGMIEYQSNLNESYFVEVAFTGGEKLLFGENNTTFKDINLGQVNGAAARAEVIEFFLPESTLSTPSVASITLFGQDANGDVNTSNIIDQMK